MLVVIVVPVGGLDSAVTSSFFGMLSSRLVVEVNDDGFLKTKGNRDL